MSSHVGVVARCCLIGSASDPAQALEDQEQWDALEQCVETQLTPRETRVIRFRFDEGLTYREIGERFGFTPERGRQILNKALRKLRHPSRCDSYGGLVGWSRSYFPRRRPLTLLDEKVAHDVRRNREIYGKNAFSIGWRVPLVDWSAR